MTHNKPSQTQSQTKLSQAKPSQTKPSQTKQLSTAQSSNGYSLRWKGKHLLVRSAAASPTTWGFPQGFDADWVVACLTRSPIQTVRLDLHLSADLLEAWADAAQRSGKNIYVSLPVMAKLPQKTQPVGWLLKRSIDYLVTTLLMVVLLPMILGLILILQPQSWQSIFVRQWHVGERGRLFRTFRLRTQDEQGNWLRGGRMIYQSKLDRLPKFFNVLSGEMSLVGSCPWRIEDAAQADMALRHRLNGLPGVVGFWMLQARWKILDSYFLSQIDLDYLWNWSLVGDLRLLVLMLSKMVNVAKLINA